MNAIRKYQLENAKTLSMIESMALTSANREVEDLRTAGATTATIVAHLRDFATKVDEGEFRNAYLKAAELIAAEETADQAATTATPASAA